MFEIEIMGRKENKFNSNANHKIIHWEDEIAINVLKIIEVENKKINGKDDIKVRKEFNLSNLD